MKTKFDILYNKIINECNTKTPAIKNEDTTEDCWLCKGYGELKSHSDEPDRICPACNGSGKRPEPLPPDEIDD